MPNIHSSITFGLVNIPIIVNPLIKNNDTSFNQLHKTCLNRINYVKYCPYCKMKLKEKDIIKGYEYVKGEYLTFTKDELLKLKPEKNNEIEIVAFILLKEIDPIYFEKSYILNVEKKSKAYSLFKEALKKSKKVALAKTVIGSKFYYCILRDSPFGIIMTTLFFKEEVMLKEEVSNNFKLSEKELSLAMQLIKELSTKFVPDKYQDEYQNNIKNAINLKANGKKVKINTKRNKKQINDLMISLEKSLKKKK